MNQKTIINIELDKPHINQQKILDGIKNNKYVIAATGRQFGKSLLALNVCIEKILNAETVCYITPFSKQARKFYRKVLLKIPKELIEYQNATDMELKLITGGILTFFSAENINNARGITCSYAVIDEAAFLDFNEVLKVITPALAIKKGGYLAISTFNGKDAFNSKFEQGQRKENGFISFHFTSLDNPYFSKEEFENQRKTLPKQIFEQEYLALSLATSSPFGTNIYNNILKELSKNKPILYSVDLASTGDWTVVTSLDENKNLCYYERFQGDWNIIEERIKKLPKDIPLIMDISGSGKPLFDKLQLYRNNLIGIVWNNKIKLQMYYKLIVDVENGNIKYNEITANEMSTMESKRTANGSISINSKNGYFDDSVASLAQCNFHFNEYVAKANWSVFLS